MKFCLLRQYCLVILLGAYLSPGWAGPKTDVIYLNNGDRVTGEIKSMFRGKLEVSTDHMGTVLIDWSDIREVVSKSSQAVELANGVRFLGPLDKAAEADAVIINTEQGKVDVENQDIIAMYPVEAGFWDRLDISAKLGFTWDKSSNVGKANLGIDTVYRDVKFITRASFNTEITTQQNRDNSTRAVLNATHMRFLPNKKFRGFFGSMEQNDELGLDLRALVGGGYGWIPIRSQRSLFTLMAGLDVNYEIPSSGDAVTSVELVGSLSYDYFFYSHPERHFRVDLSVFPNLTESGRWRANLSSTFKVELFRDLYWDLSMYASYDNKPLAADAATSDYGVTSSLGYKF